MSKDDEFIAFLLDPLQLMGPVVARRMFGGAGLFLDDLMFGLVSDRVLYLKVGRVSQQIGRASGRGRWVWYS